MSRTTIGNVGSAWGAAVDRRGLVTPAPGWWSLDWSVGADDRWHVAAREAAVRQRLVGAAPVVETAMRIPNGDAVHRAYAVRAAGDEVVVVEVENRSPVPVAVAFAVVGADATVDGATVVVGGRPAVVLPRPPAGAEGPGTFVVPLPHRATVRLALPAPGAGRVRPGALPGADRVAAGWAAHAGRGLRLELPDERLAEAVEANRRFALLLAAGTAPDDAAEVAVALDRHGFHAEAAEALAGAGGDPAGLLAALAWHWRLTRDAAFAADAAWAVAEACARLDPGRRRRSSAPPAARRAALDAAEVLWAAGEPRAAADAERLAATLPVGAGAAPAGDRPGAMAAGPAAPDAGVRPGAARDVLAVAAAHLAAGDRRALDGLAAVLRAASPTWTWDGHDRVAAARFLTLVRDLLVREVPGGLALCPLVPDRWRGQGVEVADAPTAAGRLSYAVRWHGDRPALLWDLTPAAGPARLTAPGLDRSWSSTEPTGEALLG